jgi:hypothetical protein
LPTAPLELNGPPTRSAVSATSPPFSNLEPTEPVLFSLAAAFSTASLAASSSDLLLDREAGVDVNVRVMARDVEVRRSVRENMFVGEV